jgi:hypothetical protein
MVKLHTAKPAYEQFMKMENVGKFGDYPKDYFNKRTFTKWKKF